MEHELTTEPKPFVRCERYLRNQPGADEFAFTHASSEGDFTFAP